MKSIKFIRILLLLCLILAITYCILLVIYNRQNEEIIPVSNEIIEPIIEEPKVYKASLFMVGDMLLHSVVYKDASIGNGNYDFNNMLEYLKPIVKKNDLSYYNQETIIGGKNLGLSSYPRFNSPDEIGNNMVDIGFNLISLANNHTLDKNESGVLYSTEFWKNKEAVTAGSYPSFEEKNEVHVYEVNNITYGFLAYTESTNCIPVPDGKDYLVDVYEEEKIKEDIFKLRDKVDVIIVSIHFGTEYTHNPTDSQLEKAKFLADQGVDIVVGSHPHVVQPITYIDDTVVVYSLGNLVSAQDSIYTLIGLMARLEITKTVDGDNIDINIGNITADLLYTYYENYKNFKIIPFGVLTNETLQNSYVGNYRYNINTYGDKEYLYEKYSNIVTSMSDKVTMIDMYNE